MNHSPHNQPKNESQLTTEEQAVKQAISQYLDAEVNDIDFNVSSKLAAARHRALDQLEPEKNNAPNWAGWSRLAGGGVTLAMAMTTAIVIGTQLYNPTIEVTAPDTTAVTQSDLIEDLPLLASGDDIEFYESIEFLEWLENNS